MERIFFTIPPLYHNRRIYDFLRNEKLFSSKQIRKLKQSPQGILQNQRPTRTINLLKKGDILSVCLQEGKNDTIPYPLSLPILYEDSHLIIFNKPPDMESHPSVQNWTTTLANVYQYHNQKKGVSPVFHPIHRLDKNTSGAILIGKNSYITDLVGKNVSKTYWALVTGTPAPTSGKIDAPIGRCAHSIITRQVDPQGQHARTQYSLVQSFGPYSLMNVQLETGRTHQIRVHFSHVGHPLLGDDLYGGSLDFMPRHGLHCKEITFFHPFKHKTISISCPLPPDMERLIHPERE